MGYRLFVNLQKGRAYVPQSAVRAENLYYQRRQEARWSANATWYALC